MMKSSDLPISEPFLSSDRTPSMERMSGNQHAVKFDPIQSSIGTEVIPCCRYDTFQSSAAQKIGTMPGVGKNDEKSTLVSNLAPPLHPAVMSDLPTYSPYDNESFKSTQVMGTTPGVKDKQVLQRDLTRYVERNC